MPKHPHPNTFVTARTVLRRKLLGELGQPLAHAPANARREVRDAVAHDTHDRAGEILEDANANLRRWLSDYKGSLTDSLRRQLEVDRRAARAREDERYRQRQGEVSSLIEQSTLERLTREIEQLENSRRQGRLFDEAEDLAAIQQSMEQKQEELARRRLHYEDIREQLQRERTRILDHLLPARFSMAGEAQVFPVAVEIRLPGRRA